MCSSKATYSIIVIQVITKFYIAIESSVILSYVNPYVHPRLSAFKNSNVTGAESEGFVNRRSKHTNGHIYTHVVLYSLGSFKHSNVTGTESDGFVNRRIKNKYDHIKRRYVTNYTMYI